MDYRNISLDVTGAIGRLWLDRPTARNAMSPEMGREMVRAVGEINAASHLRALVIAGRGKGFSAGGDFSLIEERAQDTEAANQKAMRAFYDLFLSIVHVEVPTIAAIHGAAMGAGIGFALACDFRIATDDATMGFNFVKIGLHPGMGVTHTLPSLVGPARARVLLLTGRVISAEEAHRIGLVDRLVPADQLEAAVEEWASELSTAAPDAVRRTKRTLARTAFEGLEAALDRESEAQAKGYATKDIKEAIQAFREKRSPKFSGQ